MELPSYIAIDLITSNRWGSVHFETSLVSQLYAVLSHKFSSVLKLELLLAVRISSNGALVRF